MTTSISSEAHKQKIIDVDKNELVGVNVQLSQEKKIGKPKARSKFVKPLKVGKIIIFPITLWTECRHTDNANYREASLLQSNIYHFLKLIYRYS